MTRFAAPLIIAGSLCCQVPVGWAQVAQGPAESSSIRTGAQSVAVSDAELMAALWRGNPRIRQARSQVQVAQAELLRAAALPNPGLDLSWGTLPLGPSNPPNLSQPWLNTPNYGIAVRQPLEPGKRGPRTGLVQAEVRTTAAESQTLAQEQFFALKEAIGQIAMAQLRGQAFDQLLTSSKSLLELQRVRSKLSDVAGLDLLRAEGEHSRLEAVRAGLDQEAAEALAVCADLVAAPCQPFSDGAAAQAWLNREWQLTEPLQWSQGAEERRADFQSLAAQVQAAQALSAVAKAARWPDVEARVGYLYDTFTVSGNQRHSLNVGLGVALPVWQAGQAESRAAAAALSRAQDLRQAQIDQAKAGLVAAARRLQLAEQRQLLLNDSLARTQKVVDGMMEALRRGGTSLSDVLQARHTHAALVLEQLDTFGDRLRAAQSARRLLALAPPAP